VDGLVLGGKKHATKKSVLSLQKILPDFDFTIDHYHYRFGNRVSAFLQTIVYPLRCNNFDIRMELNQRKTTEYQSGPTYRESTRRRAIS
jgi:hypothetical protein